MTNVPLLPFASPLEKPLAELRLKLAASSPRDSLLSMLILFALTCLSRTLMRLDLIFAEWCAGTLPSGALRSPEAPHPPRTTQPHKRTTRPAQDARMPTEAELVRHLDEILRPAEAPSPLHSRHPDAHPWLGPLLGAFINLPPPRRPIDRWPRSAKRASTVDRKPAPNLFRYRNKLRTSPPASP
jgi:hypothetical protein